MIRKIRPVRIVQNVKHDQLGDEMISLPLARVVVSGYDVGRAASNWWFNHDGYNQPPPM